MYSWKFKTIYRKTMIILAVLQLLAYFILPYGVRPWGYSSRLYPRYITGAAMMGAGFTEEPAIALMFLMPFLFLIGGTILMHCLGRGVASYIGTLVTEFFILLYHFFHTAAVLDIGYYYRISMWSLVIYLLWLLCIILAIMGIVNENREQAYMRSGMRYSNDPVARGLGRTGDRIYSLTGRRPGVSPGPYYGSYQAPVQHRQVAQQQRAIPVAGRSIPQAGVMTGVRGTFAGSRITLNAGAAMTLGRSAEMCNVIVSGSMVSRRHCTIVYDGRSGNYYVTDFSENGTFTGNGNRLPFGRQTVLAPGTLLLIGSKDNSFQLG